MEKSTICRSRRTHGTYTHAPVSGIVDHFFVMVSSKTILEGKVSDIKGEKDSYHMAHLGHFAASPIVLSRFRFLQIRMQWHYSSQ
jgi:hypothetical protein